jgi:hypothetical protein
MCSHSQLAQQGSTATIASGNENLLALETLMSFPQL